MGDLKVILGAMACVLMVMLVVVIVQFAVVSSCEVAYDSSGDVLTITCDQALPEDCITLRDIEGACPGEIRAAMRQLRDQSE